MIVDTEMVLARTGYNPKLKREVTWEELKRTFTLYKRIPMIVAGGIEHHNPIDPNLAVGHVDAKIYDDEQVIRGVPTWYKERFKDIPNEIQKKLASKERIYASLGYQPFDNIRKVDHILIGAESPLFPDIGFNAESGLIYEETEGMNNEEEAKKEPDIAEIVRTEMDKQFKLWKETFFPQKEKEPQVSQEETAVEEHTTVEEIQEPLFAEEPQDSQPTPQIEPERTLPRTHTKPTRTTSDGMFELDGTRIISTPLGGHNSEARKKEQEI